jgi:hypothetical protein
MTVATVTATVASAQEAAATSAVAAAVLAEDHVVDPDQAAVEVVAVVKIKVWLLKKLINTRFLLNT